MAKRRVTGQGRSIVALLLLGFVLVSAVVIWRRSHGIAQARDLSALQQEHRQLTAERARLERDIRDASARARLVGVAERRLGMHLPSDSEIVILPRPTTADAPPPP